MERIITNTDFDNEFNFQNQMRSRGSYVGTLTSEQKSNYKHQLIGNLYANGVYIPIYFVTNVENSIFIFEQNT